MLSIAPASGGALVIRGSGTPWAPPGLPVCPLGTPPLDRPDSDLRFLLLPMERLDACWGVEEKDDDQWMGG